MAKYRNIVQVMSVVIFIELIVYDYTLIIISKKTFTSLVVIPLYCKITVDYKITIIVFNNTYIYLIIKMVTTLNPELHTATRYPVTHTYLLLFVLLH